MITKNQKVFFIDYNLNLHRNRTRDWKFLRQYFQRAVNSEALNLATKITFEAVDSSMRMFPSFKDGGGKLDLLAFLRTVTLDVTNRYCVAIET